MNTEYLFVYGTLMTASSSPQYQKIIKPFFSFVGKALTTGELYDLGNYPGLVQTDNKKSKVHGEVFSFNADQVSLLKLDEYEGCDELSPQPHHYYRKKTDTWLEDRTCLSAWCYFYQASTEKAHRIKDGDYSGTIT